MDNSIEKIWKHGFLEEGALVAPKVNQLFERKSIHLVDKYKRMFKTNILFIVGGSFLLLVITIIGGMKWLGILMFFILNAMAIIDHKLMQKLEEVEQWGSSYHYLKSVDKWMRQKTRINIQVARLLYPYTFLSMVMGFWFLQIKGQLLGHLAVEQWLIFFPETRLFMGIPVIVIIAAFLIATLLALLGGKIYRWDVNLVYGPILSKLEDMLADMEELRS